MITEKQAEKLMKETSITITKSMEDWRQIGEMLSHYKKLMSSFHQSRSEEFWEGETGKKFSDARGKIADQIVMAMHQEETLLHELTKQAAEKLHPAVEELIREHKKTK